MKTLIIYDNEGVVFFQQVGNYKKPVGIQYIEVVVPEGKLVDYVDVEKSKPVYKDIEKTETQYLKEELEQTKLALAELAEVLLGGI